MFVQFLGPAKLSLPAAVDIHYETISASELHITLSACEDVEGLGTGVLDNPSTYMKWVPNNGSNSQHIHWLGFQCAEFALPVRAASCDLRFNFFSRPDFHRPHSVVPLFAMNRNTKQVLLLAPLDSFHEQVLAVDTQKESELRWGWSGDLTGVSQGFRTTLAVLTGESPRLLLSRWGAAVRARHAPGLPAVGRYADISTARLSMWTDNGASYWYRTEEGMDMSTTLERTVCALEEENVPIGSVEIDSWWYQHEKMRKISPVGYPQIVPPTGMVRWEPRVDALGDGGMHGLRDRVGLRPLVLHSRHISAKTSYINDPSMPDARWWIDNGRAHPRDDALWCRWMQQAADWGVCAYEQDWLVEMWLGVRQLRERPGRIATWQRNLNSAAAQHAVNLIWCMATPADFAYAVALNKVVAIRTSDDYRYAEDASDLWRWHLTVNCMASALGLWPFKDVFMSHTNDTDVPTIDGDPNNELEALLAALSAGPVAIGDRLGRTNRNVVMRTCRADGTLIKPDAPLCALDRSLMDKDALLWADTYSGEWRYVVVINARRKKEAMTNGDDTITESLSLGGKRLLAYNWKTGTAELTSSLTAKLRAHQWCLWVVCPVRMDSKNGGFSVIGDTSVYATMGDRRVRVNTPFSEYAHKPSLDVVGTPGEKVDIAYWTSDKGVRSLNVVVGQAAWSHIDFK